MTNVGKKTLSSRNLSLNSITQGWEKTSLFIHFRGKTDEALRMFLVLRLLELSISDLSNLILPAGEPHPPPIPYVTPLLTIILFIFKCQLVLLIVIVLKNIEIDPGREKL